MVGEPKHIVDGSVLTFSDSLWAGDLRREASGVDSLRCPKLFMVSFESMSVLLSLHTCEGHQKERTCAKCTVHFCHCCVSAFFGSC